MSLRWPGIGDDVLGEKPVARQWSRQVGAERWASLEHEHIVIKTFSLPSACKLPLHKVPGWSVFGLPPGS